MTDLEKTELLRAISPVNTLIGYSRSAADIKEPPPMAWFEGLAKEAQKASEALDRIMKLI